MGGTGAGSTAGGSDSEGEEPLSPETDWFFDTEVIACVQHVSLVPLQLSHLQMRKGLVVLGCASSGGCCRAGLRRRGSRAAAEDLRKESAETSWTVPAAWPAPPAPTVHRRCSSPAPSPLPLPPPAGVSEHGAAMAQVGRGDSERRGVPAGGGRAALAGAATAPQCSAPWRLRPCPASCPEQACVPSACLRRLPAPRLCGFLLHSSSRYYNVCDELSTEGRSVGDVITTLRWVGGGAGRAQ